MNKVLHIVHSDLGGSASIVFSIIKKKTELWKNNVLFTGPKLHSDYSYQIKQEKLILNYVKVRKHLNLFYTLLVLLRICKIKPDIIILHNYQLLPVIIYKFFFNKNIIYVDHKPFNLKNFRDYITLFFMFIFAKYIITINYKNFFFIKKYSNFFSSKILLIKNGVNVNEFSPKCKKNKKNYFLFGMASRINKDKFHDLIIDAICNKNLNSNIICHFAGDGEYKDILIQRVIKEKLTKKIIFLATLNKKDYKKWLNKIDLYVQCTKSEGMSISVLEALSSGVPVLGSNVSGNNEILEKQKFVGKLFDNNVNNLVENLNYFKTINQKLLNKYKINGRNYIIKYHNEDEMINKYNDIIKSLI
jgi:glycosyltransferase involved in cell wall biosynthesis